MLIDDEEFSLGIPTMEEMLRHHVLLVENESQQLSEELVKARQRIASLVTMNDALSFERDNLKADLHDCRLKLSAQYVLHTRLTNMARSRGLLSIDECSGVDDADYQKAISHIKSYAPRTG